MHQINPKKLLHSKWTAVTPKNKEKHFLVTDIDFDEEGAVERCELEAVMSKRAQDIDWEQLKDAKQWKMGWK